MHDFTHQNLSPENLVSVAHMLAEMIVSFEFFPTYAAHESRLLSTFVLNMTVQRILVVVNVGTAVAVVFFVTFDLRGCKTTRC